MEGKRRQKGERLIVTKVESASKGGGLFPKGRSKVRNRRQKFLKVGQKFKSRRDRKRGLFDSELKKGEEGYKKSSDSSEKREQERETYVTLTSGRE